MKTWGWAWEAHTRVWPSAEAGPMKRNGANAPQRLMAMGRFPK